VKTKTTFLQVTFDIQKFSIRNVFDYRKDYVGHQTACARNLILFTLCVNIVGIFTFEFDVLSTALKLQISYTLINVYNFTFVFIDDVLNMTKESYFELVITGPDTEIGIHTFM
jgi:hypothetical protein